MHRSTTRSIILVLALTLTSCGKKPSSTATTKDDAATGPQIAPITAPPSGVDAVKRMNFVYGDGWHAYDKAVAAYRAKDRDWASVRKHAEIALARDPLHLDAHYLLARALAQVGEHATAVDHLVTALAGDYFRYGPVLATEPELEEFLATPHGQAVTALAARIRDDYAQRIAASPWVVARRSAFRWPKELGVQHATSRGELYAYDRASKRYLRLSHTDHKVVGFVRAPGGGEVALLGVDKIDRPKRDPNPAGARDAASARSAAPARNASVADAALSEAPATFATAWIQRLDTTSWQPVGAKILLPPARELSLGYGEDARLVVTTAQASGRWGTTAPVVSTIDPATGALSTISAPPPAPRIEVTLDAARVVGAPRGVEATWAGDPPTAPTLSIGGAVIQVPESGAASQSTVAVAPGGARLAFATAVDPCAKNVAPSLYVADAKTGELAHLLTARSRFVTRWIDDKVLAYEDGEGAVRLWDATTGRQVLALSNPPGIALEVLSTSAAPLCKQEPPTIEPAGEGALDEPLPPEEPGPVTAPE